MVTSPGRGRACVSRCTIRPQATRRCAASGRILAESALHALIQDHNFSTRLLGGRSGGCTQHRLGAGGVWHAPSNLSIVDAWLAEAESPLAMPSASRTVVLRPSDARRPGGGSAPPDHKTRRWASRKMCSAAARSPAAMAGKYWASPSDCLMYSERQADQ